MTELDARPAAVLAYTDSLSMGPDGALMDKTPKTWSYFDSSQLTDRDRVFSIVQAKGFGKMIYGLFRAEAIEKAGGFPAVLFPDVAFLWRLSCYGDFLFVPHPHYLRRETKGRLALRDLVARQRRNLFPAPTLAQRLPASLQVPLFFLTTPLRALPDTLAPRQSVIRRRFAWGFFLRIIKKSRWLRPFCDPRRALTRAYVRLTTKA